MEGKNCSGKAKEQAKEQKLQRKNQGTKKLQWKGYVQSSDLSIILSRAEFDQEGVGFLKKNFFKEVAL